VLVTVIIPAYRPTNDIRKTLDSVFAQTFSDYEVIVINDGSPESELLERKLQPYQGRIRYIKQANRGPSAARNVGILEARSKYVAFLDSDDRWLEAHLENQTSLLLKNPTLGLVYADCILVNGNVPIGRSFVRQPQFPPVSFESLAVERCAAVTSSVVASRQSLIEAGLFNERFRRAEDFDLWLRMAFHGTTMDFYRGLGVVHAVSAEGLSSNGDLMKRALIEVYENLALTLPLSTTQQDLIRLMITKTEAACQVELLKQSLDRKNYEDARAAAIRANGLLPNRKLGLTILGLRRAPRLFHYAHRAYENILRARNRLRQANSARKLQRVTRAFELNSVPKVTPAEEPAPSTILGE
jgi:glycosyltransferase involved in cell wall biosynthesis